MLLLLRVQIHPHMCRSDRRRNIHYLISMQATSHLSKTRREGDFLKFACRQADTFVQR